MAVHLGIDFGTSNTVVARGGEGAADEARVVPLERGETVTLDARKGVSPDGGAEEGGLERPQADGFASALVRSVLYFPNESQEILVGKDAIDRYVSDGSGRLVQSMKSFLRSKVFTRTEIRGRSYTIEELVGVFLRVIRHRAETALGEPAERAVFGRPAVFSTDPEIDAQAERRLSDAAVMAGFSTPEFVIEPIAAALAYEARLDHDEVVLVADFGAGTSDFTVMQLGPSFRARTDRRPDVLASGGVYIGGDTFDAAIVEHGLLNHFGHKTTYRSMLKDLEVPVWLTRKLLAWNELSFLRTRENMALLHSIHAASHAPEAIGRLITLAEENLGYRLYRSVEATKIELSTQDRATLSFHELDIDIDVAVTRAAFEAWTAALRERILATVETVLETLPDVQVDAVFLTGGTSNIPSVRQLFETRFGAARLRGGDVFSSVAAGLGRASLLSAMAHGGVGGSDAPGVDLCRDHQAV